MAAKKKWVQEVTTVSTFPPEGTFEKDAEEVARIMASKKVSPKGIGSGIRMIQYFINRAGKNLPPERRQELEKAKDLLHAKLEKQKTNPSESATSLKRKAPAARGPKTAKAQRKQS